MILCWLLEIVYFSGDPVVSERKLRFPFLCWCRTGLCQMSHVTGWMTSTRKGEVLFDEMWHSRALYGFQKENILFPPACTTKHTKNINKKISMWCIEGTTTWAQENVCAFPWWPRPFCCLDWRQCQQLRYSGCAPAEVFATSFFVPVAFFFCSLSLNSGLLRKLPGVAQGRLMLGGSAVWRNHIAT